MILHDTLHVTLRQSVQSVASPIVLGLMFLALRPVAADTPTASCGQLHAAHQRVFPVVVDGKTGFIDQHGKLVIPARYEIMVSYANRQWHPVPASLLTEPNSDYDEFTDNQYVIGFPLFANGFCHIVKDDLVGYVREDGRVVIEPRFREAGGFLNGVASVIDRDGENCLIDTSGKSIIKGFQDCKEFREGLAPIRIGEKWGYVNLAGEYVLQPQYAEAFRFSAGRAKVRDTKGPQWQIDRTGGTCSAHRATASIEGRWFVHDDEADKWGYVDANGQLVIPYQFDDAFQFSDGLGCVSVGGKFGYINHQGEYVIEPTYDRAESFHKRRACVARFTSEGKMLEWGIIDAGGNELVPMQYAGLSWWRVPTSATWLGELPASFVVAETKQGAYVVIDMEGNTVFSLDCDGFRFADNGQLIVSKESGKGLVDFHGRAITAPIFDYIADQASEGFRRVYVAGKGEGFVDEYGTVVIEPRFDYAEDFENGLARVAVGIKGTLGDSVLGGKWGYIDKSGKWVWEPTK